MIFTDRSRIKTYFSCPFERFLEYHYRGIGIRHRASTIPLVTGSYTHSAIEKILRPVLETGELPRSEDVRNVVEEITNLYQADVAATGFLNIGDGERLDTVILEQTTLISGLVWAWASYVLPRFLETFQVISVEQEMERVLGCDCGLSGLGQVTDHIGRECGGVVLMTRPDIVARHLSTNAVVYIELKTGSNIEPNTFEGDVQFAIGAAGIESYIGEELSAAYVHSLSKGYRKKDYNPETGGYDGLPRQQSSLCYAWVRPAITGMVAPDIKFKKGKGVTAAHKRTPVWEIDFGNLPDGLPSAEHYISLMSDAELQSHVNVFGPFPFPKIQIEEALADIYHLERRNAEVFDYIDDVVCTKGFEDGHVQREIHEFVPKSWNCHRYGSTCEFHPICMKQSGWQQPCDMLDALGNPLFVQRVPNHPIEEQRTDV